VKSISVATNITLSFAMLCVTNGVLAQSVGEFSTRAQVAVPSGTSIARVALPETSIVSLRETNAGDLRVFNAKGIALPHAVIDASNQASTRTDIAAERVLALPIYAPESVSPNTPTLRIEEGPNRRVIEVSSAPASKQKSETRKPRGLLFDTLKISSEINAVELEGALPPAMLLKVGLDASRDLKTWQPLVSDTPIFEFSNDGPSNRKLTLPAPQKLEGRYLRLTWSDDVALPVVALRAIASGITQNAAAPLSVNLPTPQITTDGHAEWTMQSGHRINALRVSTSANNALMPVRILTRARAGDVWRTVASTVVYRLTNSAGATNVNPSIALSSRLESQLRIEALPGYSLAGVPLTLAVEYAPLNVVFIASGDGPFDIATGRANTASAALPLTTLMPDYKSGAEYALPLLAAAVTANAATGQNSPDGNWMAAATNKSFLLWGVLGLAVIILAGLAVSLLRGTRKQ
jgi:Protein of unknown function (DUF3999)